MAQALPFSASPLRAETSLVVDVDQLLRRSGYPLTDRNRVAALVSISDFSSQTGIPIRVVAPPAGSEQGPDPQPTGPPGELPSSDLLPTTPGPCSELVGVGQTERSLHGLNSSAATSTQGRAPMGGEPGPAVGDEGRDQPGPPLAPPGGIANTAAAPTGSSPTVAEGPGAIGPASGALP